MLRSFYRSFLVGIFSFITFSNAFANDDLHLPGDLTLSDSGILTSGGIIGTGQIHSLGDIQADGKIIGAIKYDISVVTCNAGNTCDLATNIDQGFCYLSGAMNPSGKDTHNYRVYYDSSHNWKIEVSGGQNVSGIATCIKWSAPTARVVDHKSLKTNAHNPK